MCICTVICAALHRIHIYILHIHTYFSTPYIHTHHTYPYIGIHTCPTHLHSYAYAYAHPRLATGNICIHTTHTGISYSLWSAYTY
ncbi:hypothetical protein BU24DRAFT_252989 [Aaosphaeria arxii CBS 175.79]|uniref:Uncharacterized protein n=1 Tax=Aaosphaeria arxii CBS 175.79 TaxID=1450172 RepID=A0A6A5XI90_9PLEO|nr:uncharacterized protein BU24DRAFT_252989 [Aaosphaeria arxii CBS 175.79]KAF2012490.1 hypothetical protein BU24DRAFT_252989 [Aaosphaeria arxii CBS 175.79]